MITEKTLKGFLKDKEEGTKITTVYMNNNSLNVFAIRDVYTNIEFLSVQDNNIKDISFLKCLPNIYYFDVRNNPIEKYEVFNTINCFGFLGISVERYNEKKILCVKKLNAGILNLVIEENYKKAFKNNNPNIIKFNEEIMFFNERLSFLNLSNNSTGENNSTNNLINSAESVININNGSKIKNYNFKTPLQRKTTMMNALLQNLNSSSTTANELAKTIFSFFEQFNKEITTMISNSNFSSVLKQEFSDNPVYLQMEKNKLILLAKIYEKTLVLNRDDSAIFYLTRKKINQKTNLLTNELLADLIDSSNSDSNPLANKFCNFFFFKIKEVSLLIVILIVMILYILQIIGKDIIVVLIKDLFKTHLNLQIKTTYLKSFFEMDVEYLLGIYYDTYDHFLEVYNKSYFDSTSFNISEKHKYDEIKISLEMSLLILQVNILKENKTQADKIYKANEDLELRKGLINTILIKLLDEKLQIFNHVLILLQYINDYIVLNKIDAILLGDHTFQFRVFMEVKELMFNHLNKKTKGNLIYDTVTYRKFADIKFKRFGNKLFFERKRCISERKEKEIANMFSFLNKGPNYDDNNKLKSKVVTGKENYKLNNSNEMDNYQLVPRSQNENLKSQDDFLNSSSIQINKSLVSTHNLNDKRGSEDYNINHEEEAIPKEDVESLVRIAQLSYMSSVDSYKITQDYSKFNEKHLKLISPQLNKVKSYSKMNLSGSHFTQSVDKNYSLSASVNRQIRKLNASSQFSFSRLCGEQTNYSNNIDSLKNKLNYNKNKHQILKQSVYNLSIQKQGKNRSVDLSSPKVLKRDDSTFNKSFKTIYNFRSNLDRLTHHWNSNNVHVKMNNLMKNSQDDTNAIVDKKNVNNYMTGEEIYNLFGIESKNDFIKGYTMNTKNKKYTIKALNKKV